MAELEGHRACHLSHSCRFPRLHRTEACLELVPDQLAKVIPMVALKPQFGSKILEKTKLIRGFSTGLRASDIETQKTGGRP